jgi:hypothetical protein
VSYERKLAPDQPAANDLKYRDAVKRYEMSKLPPIYDEFNQSAAIGYLPGDWKCDTCGQWYNASGQAIRDPQTWSPEDAGESWDEE